MPQSVNGGRTFSSINSVGKLETHMKKERERLDAYLSPLLKWIKSLNIRDKTIKFKRHYREELHDIRFGNDFLNMTSKSQAIKEKNR
jgi:hypothetical protein